MPFEVIFHQAFESDFDALPEPVQDELLVRTGVLEEFGPGLGRPNVDTLNGSAYPNMKELRFRLDGVWRFAFAWDPHRRAVILCGGDKEGADQKRFYKRLIRLADARFARHVAQSEAVTKSRSRAVRTRVEMLDRLPAVRREAIKKRTQELVLKEKILREMRKEHGLSQKAVAEALGVGQDSVSRLERRGDCLVSTMRGYVEAMGGHLRLVAEFPGTGPVEIVADDIRSLAIDDGG